MLFILMILADSLTLYTHALETVQWYKDHGYAVEAYYDAVESPWAVLARAVGRFYENVDEGSYRLSNGKYVDWTKHGITDDTYRRSINQYEFYQYEPSTAYVNLDAPMQRFDTRIVPNRIVRLYGFGKPPFKEYYGDIVYVYLYAEPPEKFIPTERQRDLLYFLNGDRITKELFERVISNGVDTISIRKNLDFKIER